MKEYIHMALMPLHITFCLSIAWMLFRRVSVTDYKTRREVRWGYSVAAGAAFLSVFAPVGYGWTVYPSQVLLEASYAATLYFSRHLWKGKPPKGVQVTKPKALKTKTVAG